MSTISVKSKSRMSILSGGGKCLEWTAQHLKYLKSESARPGQHPIHAHPCDRLHVLTTFLRVIVVYCDPPVSLEHTPHGPVDGPEVCLRPPIARQLSAGHESTCTPSTYSVQALSPLSAQFPQVPTRMPSRLQVMSTHMEDKGEGEGLGSDLGGEKSLSHAINPVSPLLYASFGANKRHLGHTEETEMQSSGYSESDDGQTSRNGATPFRRSPKAICTDI
ncbi:hypothetical protein EV424DRAFT_1534943 [Suillus variegatus]|nr:hypothetical protein EV424DRAFT_1534943 [Suillus variegatus]